MNLAASAVTLALGIAVVALATTWIVGVYRLARREGAPDRGKGSRQSAERQPDVADDAPLLRRITALETELQAVKDRLTNVTDTADERYRRLSQRIRGDAPAAVPGATEDDRQLRMFERPPAAAAAPPVNGTRRHLIPRR